MAGKAARPVSERFFEKVEPVTESGCWLWTASTNRSGYGQFMIKPRPYLAHRVSWSLLRGSIPEGMHVLHKCDTPACVNPDHLFLGTDADNVKDMYAKGRQGLGNRLCGERHGMAKIPVDVVKAVFLADSGTQKQIAERFGITESSVNAIRSGRQWSSVTSQLGEVSSAP